MASKTAEQIIQAAQTLREQVNQLSFTPPVTHVYNPLDYAWQAHQQYLSRYATGPRQVLFLGMNPGPWGMAQCGVPFGEVNLAKTWLKINAPIGQPDHPHPKRPIEGLACTRSEVSGRRLWGLFAERYQNPQAFFKNNLVLNYCPLVFMEQSGKNRTPDKLPVTEAAPLNAACDEHLSRVIELLKPKYLIGVGAYAQACLKRVAAEHKTSASIVIDKILHPSPASPAANRGWAEQATKQLEAIGIW